MVWNNRAGDKQQQAEKMAREYIVGAWGGTAYTRATKRGDTTHMSVQVALVKERHYDWQVSTFNPWVTDDGKLVNSSGCGVGTGFSTKADAVAVARALVRADWKGTEAGS